MSRRANLVILLGLGTVILLLFGVSAGAAQEGIVDTETEIKETQQRLAELRMEADAAGQAYSNALFQLEQLNDEIASTTEDLASAEEGLAEVQDRLSGQASQMYKSGNIGFIDVLVGANDFSEFANRLELWMRLLARSQAEFAEVRAAKDELEAQLSERERQLEEREAAVAEAETQKEQAGAFETEAQDYLGSLNEDLRAEIEAEQARQAEAARIRGEELLEELAQAEPQPVRAAQSETAQTTVETMPVAEEAQQPVDEGASTRDLAAEQAAAQEAAAAAAENARLAAEQKEAERKAEEEAAEQAAAAQMARQDAEKAAASEREAAQKSRQDAVAKQAAEKGKQDAERSAAQERMAAQAVAKEAEHQAKLAADQAAAYEKARQDAEQAASAEREAAQKAATAAQPTQPNGSRGGQPTPPPAGVEPKEGQPKEGQPKEGQPKEEQLKEGQPTPAAGPASAGAVLAEGAKYMGTPYLLGGPEVCVPYETMDCSCFTLTVYASFGISLPDSPGGQLGYGTPVYGEPAAGDLVFYNEDGSGITHVGIATGNGTILHASIAAGFVTESSIDAPAGRLPEARRLL